MNNHMGLIAPSIPKMYTRDGPDWCKPIGAQGMNPIGYFQPRKTLLIGLSKLHSLYLNLIIHSFEKPLIYVSLINDSN